MNSKPPSYASAQSVSRTKTSQEEVKSRADAMLRDSLTRGSSVTRPQVASDGVNSLADEMLRSSLSQNAIKPASEVSLTSSTSTSLPSYRSKPQGVQATTSAGPAGFRHPGLKTDSLKARKIQLQREIDEANAALPRRETKGLFKIACSTDLMFLIDTTASMGPYIDTAKEQVKTIVDDIQRKFLNQSEVRMAVVSYKDHGDSGHLEFLDFTSSVEAVHQFLARLRATGGGDPPEDVLGGLQMALHASWKQQTRCIIHIADAPAHGELLHDMGASSDNYHSVGSEPHGLTHEPLLRKLIECNLNYTLLRIKQHTDRMAFVFSGVYGYSNARLLPNNAYYHHTSSDTSRTVGRSISLTAPAPQFEEAQLGTAYSELRNLVVKSVTDSITRTAGHLTTKLGRTTKLGLTSTLRDLTVIREDDSAHSRRTSSRVDVALEKGPPQWTTSGWFDSKIEVTGFCPAVLEHDANTLNDMIDADENIKLSAADLTVFARSMPFAQGALRLASYARTSNSTNRFVIKIFKDDDHGRAEVTEDMRMQALCKAFALEFNSLLKIEPPLDFLVTSCLQTTTPATTGSGKACLSLEPFIEGNYIKYNSNGAYVNHTLGEDPFNQMAQAFSHFTFERSWGLFLVNDLQGVGHLLTDPSIQTRDPERFKLNDTNLHEEGFKFFFATHECNSFCRQLELQSTGEMLISGEFTFREHWPVMDPTACCSNKFCRSIIHLSSAHKSKDFPGHNWCDKC
ncbi:uncharacterized protein LTR77_000425 [Saxophila tyrrhenica]|uniref:Alpha-type protein kinase domain-containing protein n=1 Tax=Saxophila tyrrhenica TaxID=1690608 RepID=A0AAV9PR42_9PEZI|nr:hypothetical protein LTR77_000425 [Saxophila tyrrhenica]